MEIVHAHDDKANWVALLACRSRRTRAAPVSAPRLLQEWDCELLQRFDLIAEASPESCARLRAYPGIADRVGLGEHGVEASGGKAQGVLPRREGQFVVLVAARLELVKRHKLFFEAMERVTRTLANVRIWVAGDGPLENGLKRYAQDLGLSERIRFLGYRPDLANVFRHAGVAVVASSFETSCRAAMEALAFGCPLVAAPVGIIPELSEEGKTLAISPHRDAARMADAILRMLEERELAQRMRARGQAKVLQSGGHRTAAAALASVYAEALAGR